jgi:hypothetical protein
MKHLNKFNEHLKRSDIARKNAWTIDQFCDKWGISKGELSSRTYSVDESEPVTLIDLININTDAVMAPSIDELEQFIPLTQIMELGVGETYEPGPMMGAPVKRIS